MLFIRVLELSRPTRDIHKARRQDSRSCLALLTLTFSIGDSDDELGRMLAVLRFWFTKDLVGPIYQLWDAKPYRLMD